MERIAIIGAGPAGAAAAYMLQLKGYDVYVFDNSPSPGFKACGWAVPVQLEKTLRLPSDAILNKIRGFRVYIDYELAHEYHGSVMGYIVDKPRLLSIMLEGSTVVNKTIRINFNTQPYCITPLHFSKCIIATGSVTEPPVHDFIYAIHADVNVSSVANILGDYETIELWFDRNLVGYYWVFPRGDKIVNIGVGGYENVKALHNRLVVFLRRLGIKNVGNVKGARINVSGVKTGVQIGENTFVVGEAAGFVYPLTGEGIRPAIESGAATAEHISSGIPVMKRLENTMKWINRQRVLLEKVKKAKPETRAALLKSIPTELLPLIGIGSLARTDLLKTIAKAPMLVSKILRALL